MLHTHIDHLVVAAPSLTAGSDYIRRTLGVPTHAGGEHTGMGTHNCLVRLGASVYLEVIALNPAAPPARRKPLFGLDRLDPHAPPALLTWVASCADLDAAVAASPFAHGEIIAMNRGALDWRLTIPADGILPANGIVPSLIQWESQAHPAASLPDVGCSLTRLEGFHQEAARIRDFLSRTGFDGAFHITEIGTDERPYLIAHIQTPNGPRQLRGLAGV